MNILFIERSLIATSVVYDQIQRIKKNHSIYILSVDQKELPSTQDINRIQYFNFPKIEKFKFNYFFKAVLKGIEKHLMTLHSMAFMRTLPILKVLQLLNYLLN